MAFGALSQNLVHVLNNIHSGLLPALWRFFSGASYLMGILLAFRSIYQFKVYGEMRVMMSSNTDLKRPVTSLLVGLAFLYAPFVARSFLQTIFHISVPVAAYAYNIKNPSVEVGFHDAVIDVGAIIELLGFFAFIRGLFILNKSMEQGAGQHTASKALTHMLGGVFAMNIFGFWAIFQNTFGIHL